MFINSGLNKFLNYIPVPEDLPAGTMAMFLAMTSISWMIPLIGVAEIAGGILVIIPKVRALGAIVLVPVMIGILSHHLLVDTSGLAIVLPLAGILAWVIWENRAKYLPMVR